VERRNTHLKFFLPSRYYDGSLVNAVFLASQSKKELLVSPVTIEALWGGPAEPGKTLGLKKGPSSRNGFLIGDWPWLYDKKSSF